MNKPQNWHDYFMEIEQLDKICSTPEIRTREKHYSKTYLRVEIHRINEDITFSPTASIKQ